MNTHIATTNLLANLKRLLSELDNCQPSSREQHQLLNRRKVRHDPECEQIAASLPLANSCTLEAFKAISRERQIVSQTVLGKASHNPTTEEALNTADYVFFFVGPFAFPNTFCGFLFSCELESHHPTGLAHPFDSGAVRKIFLKDQPDSEQIKFLSRHSLPVPEYRELLRRHLQLLFPDPVSYILGDEPDIDCNNIPKQGDRRRWTFEVRFRNAVSLDKHLMALFIPRFFANDWFKPVYRRALAAGVDVEWLRAPTADFESLVDACRDYILTRLEVAV